MKIIENQTFDEERALYGSDGVTTKNCVFDGPADGESAFKECKNVVAEGCYFNLRYPFWHDENLTVKDCEMTALCRAALWYSRGVKIYGGKMHGIKAVRECDGVYIEKCDIVSPEFGWSTKNITLKGCTAESEYFMLRAENVKFSDVDFNGKYSFQYVLGGEINNCKLRTKDAFWHSKNVTVTDSELIGEYLGWYSENLTLIRCKISGTQPLCYCKNLKLIDCEMENTDLCFEKSDVRATVLTPIISVKNPYSGFISAPAIGEIIKDDEKAIAEIKIG